MSDIIRLLPDSVANQIAAGEVVQRPASVVKELMENSIDAGATKVQLIAKDAGKTLIQVVDNGSGMSDTDARMSFERHATSKIQVAEDLFALKTKGFRGEALASIAAIAHVDLKTKKEGESIGTNIVVEGTKVQSQEACTTASGTNFSVKNLFYNVPARRNFLKSDKRELTHIIDEFQRVALVHPDIEFKLNHNGQELFNLPTGSLRQRIVSIFGKNFNEKLVPLSEDTDIVNVYGFIGKPEYARKTRGEQFFFLNGRFIKDNYLHHAVMRSFEELIPSGHFPSYFIYFDVPTEDVDVNIHPTKTEVKFKNGESIYAILRSTVRKSIGQFNIAPSIDFEQESHLNLEAFDPNREVRIPEVKVNHDYNPFKTEQSKSNSSGGGQSTHKASTLNSNDWKKLYNIVEQPEAVSVLDFDAPENPAQHDHVPIVENESLEPKNLPIFQLHGRYIVTQIKSGMIVIDQRLAHQRILFEKFAKQLENNAGVSQQMLFPISMSFSPTDFAVLVELQADLNAIGLSYELLGKDAIAINGVPADAADKNVEEMVESFLAQYINESDKLKLDTRHRLAASLAWSASVKQGQALTEIEMRDLIDRLFGCEIPYYSISGRPTISTFTLQDLEQKFQ